MMPLSICWIGVSANAEAFKCSEKCCNRVRFRLHENDESGRLRDISDQNIQQITTNITELDAIIADYEAKRA